MFNRNSSGPGSEPEQTPRIEFPDAITYEILEADGKWHPVVGHSVQIVEGCLMVGRGIFVDEGCTQPTAVPAMLYAPGEWKRCKTDYAGYQRRSELSIN